MAAIWRYHDHEPNGRLFNPRPTDEILEKLASRGWVDTPAKLKVNIEAEKKKAELGLADGLDLDDLDLTEQPAKPAGGVDIRKLPAAEAVTVIQALTDETTLKKILAREKGSTKPKGGRKAVLKALKDQLDEVS